MDNLRQKLQVFSNFMNYFKSGAHLYVISSYCSTTLQFQIIRRGGKGVSDSLNINKRGGGVKIKGRVGAQIKEGMGGESENCSRSKVDNLRQKLQVFSNFMNYFKSGAHLYVISSYCSTTLQFQIIGRGGGPTDSLNINKRGRGGGGSVKIKGRVGDPNKRGMG